MAVLAVDPGALDTRLTLERPVDTPDGQGGLNRTWETVASVWARLEAVSAMAAERAGQRGTTVSHRVTLRLRSDIDRTMRFTRLQRCFEISTLQDPDESMRYLVCACMEVAP